MDARAGNSHVRATERLPLKGPVAMAGGPQGIWVADDDSRSVALFDPDSARMASQVSLRDTPVTVAATAEFVGVALRAGDVSCFDAESGKELWQRSASSGDVQLKASRDRLWAWDRRASAFIAWDRAGTASRIEAEGVTAFAPDGDGIYWLSRTGIIGYRQRTRDKTVTMELPEYATRVGAMAVCAHALWLSVEGALVLVSQHPLEARATLRAPEGPVPHLICFEGRLFGGSYGVFALEPAADAEVRVLLARLQTPLRALAVSGTRLWALETGDSVVHIVGIP